jgi:hypothetical protein
MLYVRKLILISTICLCAAGATGALDFNKPNIGYLYPAGGQQGTTIQVRVGGQFIRGAKDVTITGEGVTAKVVKYFRPIRNLNGDQRRELQNKLREARNQRVTELPPKQRALLDPKGRLLKKPDPKREETKKEDGEKKPPVKLPDHPILNDLESKTLAELVQISYELFFPRNKLQQNRQLAEMAIIEVSIAPNAKPGVRELRMQSRNGITNPVIFQVGLSPETNEVEPNDKSTSFIVNNFFKPLDIAEAKELIKPKPLELPVVLNGQIMPGDTDRFRFRAKMGQQLVIETHARSLIPYLADAVPGWFQATVTLYNAAGREIAFADDYRFNPDPVLFYKIPRDGLYDIEIRDSIYRGREDFVYRIAVGEYPFITQMNPLGGKQGVKTTARIEGWNLPEKQLQLDTQPRSEMIRRTSYYDKKRVSNFVPYAVNTLPESNEAESNDTIKNAQKIDLPTIINGQIQEPGDIDVFQISGKAGDKIAAEVYARRLNSPLDSLLRLTDASGTVLQWNDDHIEKDKHLHKDILGLQTHHADSYLIAELPKDGTYYVHLADSQHHGSEAHSYRLRLARSEGDFSLRVTPSGLTIAAGGIIPIEVFALRKDGYEGPIEVVLKEPDKGFRIGGGTIPAGRGKILMTLTAPDEIKPGPVDLKLEGHAKIGDKIVKRSAVGADDTMQAFLFRHLVPAQKLSAFVQKSRWRMPPVELVGNSPIKISAGGSVQVRLKTKPRPILKEIDLELYKPPAGIVLQDVTVVPEGLSFVLEADKDMGQSDISENLIIQIFREHVPKQKEGNLAPKKRRDSMGIIPAIPIQIVHKPQQDTK